MRTTTRFSALIRSLRASSLNMLPKAFAILGDHNHYLTFDGFELNHIGSFWRHLRSCILQRLNFILAPNELSIVDWIPNDFSLFVVSSFCLWLASSLPSLGVSLPIVFFIYMLLGFLPSHYTTSLQVGFFTSIVHL
jgi:hypothetical protein